MRFTPDELSRAVENLDEAYDRAKELEAANDGRWASTDKNWAAFDWLLRRRGVEVNVVLGEETFPGTEPGNEFSEGSWGYGPPEYLTPTRVATAAAALASLSEADLIRDLTPAEALAADVYSFYPETETDFAEYTAELPAAQHFFEAAAASGDAVLCWLN
ncbi:hypothetical protein Acsp02_01750 [Actinoplanes sp. NBRC 103695]|nr:hypothetical protein Acsp02_01750 [Actinoplanes sp. NBRC 103695]